MIIKVSPISASHGHNAINYAMNKDKHPDKVKPELLRVNHIDMGDITFGDPTSKDVWNLMKFHQEQFKFKRDDMFVRVELCPPMDKCRNWNTAEWNAWLDGCLRHLDDKENYYKKVPVLDKDGNPKYDRNGNLKYRIIGEPFRFQDCQFVATIHRDTANWHVHLIANRVTMDGKCMDMHKCHERAINAANKYVEELRQIDPTWKRADEYENQRKEQIYRDAIDVLKNMKAFDLDKYFDGMREKGYEVKPNTPDSNGVVHGYSIGIKIHPEDNNPLMYRSSKLGHGYALTIKNLMKTWESVQPKREDEQRVSSRPIPEQNPAPVVIIPDDDEKKRRWQKPEPDKKPTEPKVTYHHEGKPFDILKSVDDFIRSIIVLPTAADYADEEINGKDYNPIMPELDEVAETAAAGFAGMITLPLEMSTAGLEAGYISSGGVGGGGGPGTGWRDDDDEEWKERARRAAAAAGLMHAPKHGSKKSKSKGWHM